MRKEREAAGAAVARVNAANDALRRQVRENKEAKELQVQLQVRVHYWSASCY